MRLGERFRLVCQVAVQVLRGSVEHLDDFHIASEALGIRAALGPSLTTVVGALQDPTLELHDANGNVLKSNNNWKSTQEAAITATGLAPSTDLDSAILDTLAPGNTPAAAPAPNGGTGVALGEDHHRDMVGL